MNETLQCIVTFSRRETLSNYTSRFYATAYNQNDDKNSINRSKKYLIFNLALVVFTDPIILYSQLFLSNMTCTQSATAILLCAIYIYNVLQKKKKENEKRQNSFCLVLLFIDKAQIMLKYLKTSLVNACNQLILTFGKYINDEIRSIKNIIEITFVNILINTSIFIFSCYHYRHQIHKYS
ncbi:hypothetical protein V1478_012169 [Vespula squamosa]|uniref:Uncharacterized protein n=1 Tax=Vespula squamosa TaxID=30214 RepID=A0ABD2ACF0_VESSQ